MGLPTLRMCLSDPALAAFEGDFPPNGPADWAAFSVAVALGKCRLQGVDLGEEDGSLTPLMGLAAARHWLVHLEQEQKNAEKLPSVWKEALDDRAGAMELFDLACDPIEWRWSCWAAFIAIDEAYEGACEDRWARQAEFALLLDACMEAVERYDQTLKGLAGILSFAGRTALLHNQRGSLCAEYRQCGFPWWLDGTLQ